VPAAATATRSADIVATVACTSDQSVAIVGALRGREIARVTGTAGRTATTLRLPLASAGQGAVRVTLLANTAPIAERLVYRKLGSELQITVKPQSDAYAPREQVAVTIEARDPSGKPVSTELAVAVVDDAVLAMADDRSARILARLYLEPEMPGQKIDDPNFYFSADPNASAGLDLVLGTQGWRRFKRVPVAR
jgi:alpha-2-macroglobulin-like protein